MKMKVRLLSPWPASEVVVGSKMGVQMKSKMASKFVQQITSKILSLWLPSSSRHGAQQPPKSHWKIIKFLKVFWSQKYAILDPQGLPQGTLKILQKNHTDFLMFFHQLLQPFWGRFVAPKGGPTNQLFAPKIVSANPLAPKATQGAPKTAQGAPNGPKLAKMELQMGSKWSQN